MRLPTGIARYLICVIQLFVTAIIFTAVGAGDFDKERYERAIKTLRGAEDEYHRWVALDAAAKESLNQGLDDDARKYAEELESLAAKYLKDWNYGNAIHDSNVVLGRLALKAGNVESAKGHLLIAGHSPGSPQMNSFGPNMTLARDFLAKGEKEAVMEYLNLCKAFWKMERGRLEIWQLDIEQGRMPDFGANLVY